MLPSFLASFFVLLGFGLLLRHYAWILLDFLKHLSELLYHFFINSFNSVVLDLFVYGFHLLDFPGGHQSVDLISQICNSDVFDYHLSHVC
jgi:hypothetical protein